MNVRWRLAKLISPSPIMHDPMPGKDGVFIVLRENGVAAFIRAETFDLDSRSVSLATFEQWDYGKRRSVATFSGTVAR